MVTAETGDREANDARVLFLSQTAGGDAKISVRDSDQNWAARDWVAAAGLFLATAAVILWQDAHVAVLWDFSYALDSAVRMAGGQMPYRDFPFAHAPLTFLIQAAITKLTGRVFFHHVLYAAVVGASSTVLAWRIALHSLRGRVAAAWPIALPLSAPLTVLGIYCILPLPNYDCDCAFSILVGIWLLQRLAEAHPRRGNQAFSGRKNEDTARASLKGFWRSEGLLTGFAAGACVCLPVFFKQNMGLPFLLAVLAAVVSLLVAGLASGRDFCGAANAARDEQALQAAEKLHPEGSGGFDPRAKPAESSWALAPDARLSRMKVEIGLSSAASLAPAHPSPSRPVQFTGANSAQPEAAMLWAILAGVAATLLAAALLLHFTAGLGKYLHWTIQFAAQRRLPGLAAMLGVYHDANLLWTLPCMAAGVWLSKFCNRAELRVPHPRRVSAFAPTAFSILPFTETRKLSGFFLKKKPPRTTSSCQQVNRKCSRVGLRIAAFALLAAPFVFTLCSLWLYYDADERGDSLLALWPLLLVLAVALAGMNLVRAGRRVNLRMLLPFVLLAAIHGTMMSQQLWGSTYALWPLLILLIAKLIAFLAGVAPRSFVLAWTALVSATLLVCGGLYTTSEERLSYAQFPDGPAQHSAFPQLAGMATPGPYLPEFDELLRYASAHIPKEDGLILLPGEDPFYFVTGRAPQFPVLLFDPATDPYSPEQIAQLVRERNIRWLVVKRDLQIKEDPMPQREATTKALLDEFTPAAHLRSYEVYRR